MNKKLVGLIGGAVLVAGLAAAVVVVSNNQSVKDNGESTEPAVTTVNQEDLILSAQAAENVASIEVTNSKGSYTIVRISEADEEAGTSAVFGVEGWEDLPTENAIAGTLANNIASLTANSIVMEDCDNLDKYGLGEDAVKGKLNFDDGSTFEFRAGTTLADGENDYFAIEGDNTVYSVKTSLVSNYKRGAEDFLSKTLLPAPAEEDYPIVNSLTIERENMEEPIVLTYADYADDDDSLGGTAASHEMTEPIPAYLSVERSTDIITGIFGITAEKILKLYPEDADMAQYGLDEPFGTAVMDCDDGNTYTLIIGDRYTEKDEETGAETVLYPVALSGVDGIYAMKEEKCYWATVEPTDLASSLVLATFVWDIEELRLSAPGMEEMKFDITGEDVESAVVKLNGEKVDAERYRKLYTFLLKTTAEGVALNEEPVGEPEATLYFRTESGSKEQEICFYKQDAFNCLITINGESSFRTRASFIDVFKENMELFDTDEEFVTTWS